MLDICRWFGHKWEKYYTSAALDGSYVACKRCGQMKYADANKDGVPDAFEDRKPIATMLEFAQIEIPKDSNPSDFLIVILEKVQRRPMAGEMYLNTWSTTGELKVETAAFEKSSSQTIIVKVLNQ